MAVMTCFEEDHLIPIAVSGGSFFSFNRLNGCLYMLSAGSHGAYQQADIGLLANPYCIPGVPSLFDIEHSSAGTHVVQHDLTETGLGSSMSYDHPVFFDGYHQFVGAVAGPSHEVYLIFQSIDFTWARQLRTGKTQRVPHVGEVVGLNRDGIVIQTEPNTWLIADSTREVVKNSGQVVAVDKLGVLIRHRSKEGNCWSLLDETGITVSIEAPENQTIHDIGLSKEKIQAYATDSSGGQFILSSDNIPRFLGEVEEISGTAQIFSMHQWDTPLIRITGITAGSSWRWGRTSLRGAAAEESSIETRNEMVAGLACTTANLASRSHKTIVVSLHGGPDSHELDDLRYSGLYRRLVLAGAGVLIVNYPGSLGFGVDYQRSAWSNWAESVAKTCETIKTYADKMGSTKILIVGVSFGAWLGIQVATCLPNSTVFGLSPILNMSDHIEKHSVEDAEFRKWATTRFDADGPDTTRGDHALMHLTQAIHLYLPEDDEVVPLRQSERILALTELPIRSGWNIQIVPGAHYPKTVEDAQTRWNLLHNAVTSYLSA